MPYDIGQGIADGVNNFFKTYQMAKDKQKQEKLESIQPIIEAINVRLADKTLKLDEKKKLIDQVQEVYKAAGIKVAIPKGQRLSDILLPQSILDQIEDTGEVESQEAMTVTSNSSDSRNGQMRMIDVPLTKRRGDLSQAEIELGLERKHRRGIQEDTTKRDKEFRMFEFGLQQQLQSQAFTKNPEEVVEPQSGRTWSVYTNSKGEVKFAPLGAYRSERGELITEPTENTLPVSTMNARERTKGAGGGLPATMKSLIFAASRELGLPADSDEVLNLAAERYKDQYLARTSNLNLGVTKGQQATSGSEPVQPVERERLDIQNRQYKADLEGRMASAEASIQTEDEEITSTQAQIDEAKAEIKRLIEVEGYVKEDKEVKAVQKELDSYIRQQNAAKRRKGVAVGVRDKANKELKSFTSPSSSTPTPEQGGFGDKEDPKVRAAIDKLNANRRNLNLPELDDEAAKTLLRQKGYIK